MDIARPDIARAKKIRRIVYASVFAVVILLITVGVSRLEPAAPRVDKDTVYMDTVERGDMLRNVRGTGTLVAAFPRYHPRWAWGLVKLPGLREFAVSNLVLVLRPF